MLIIQISFHYTVLFLVEVLSLSFLSKLEDLVLVILLRVLLVLLLLVWLNLVLFLKSGIAGKATYLHAVGPSIFSFGVLILWLGISTLESLLQL